MDQNASRISLVNFLTAIVITAVAGVLAFYTGSVAAKVAIVFFAVNVVIAGVAAFQVRLRSREEQERLEYEGMVQQASSTGLFSSDEEDVLIAKRTRVQFERFMAPVFTILILLGQAITGISLWVGIKADMLPPLSQPLVGMAMFGVFGVGALVLGRYTASLARIREDAYLRPMASQSLLSAYLLFLLAVSLAGFEMNFAMLDFFVAKTLAVLLVALAIENVFTLVFEIYRPRVDSRRPQRVLYESRLVGLISRPEGFFATAAQTLDYQFGFKVSETWLYQFFERTLGWILLVQVVLLFSFTCVVIVEPTEQALLERLGKPVAGREVLSPGIHLKAPWPVDRVFRYRTEQVQSFHLGYQLSDEDKNGSVPVLWNTAHQMNDGTKPSEFLVASDVVEDEASILTVGGNQRTPPVNLLQASIPVQFQISDLTKWVYNHADAVDVLRAIAYRETTRYLASVDFLSVMSNGLREAATTLSERIQAEAERVDLGARIVYVGLQDIHPTVSAAASFQEVVAARQEQDAKRLEAQAYEATLLPAARAEAESTKNLAQSEADTKIGRAKGEAARFESQLAGYSEAPSVYALRAYLNSFAESIGDARVFVNGASDLPQIYELDLKDSIRDALLEEVSLTGDE